jgi:hypothetical protein
VLPERQTSELDVPPARETSELDVPPARETSVSGHATASDVANEVSLIAPKNYPKSTSSLKMGGRSLNLACELEDAGGSPGLNDVHWTPRESRIVAV